MYYSCITLLLSTHDGTCYLAFLVQSEHFSFLLGGSMSQSVANVRRGIRDLLTNDASTVENAGLGIWKD